MSDTEIKDGLYYNKDHEWVLIDGDTAVVGISDYAQNLLTDVVFVELPDVGKELKQFDPACVVESVKSVSDVYSPLGGTISEVNMALEDASEAVNTDPYGDGWMFKLTGFDTAELENLMDAVAYKIYIENYSH